MDMRTNYTIMKKNLFRIAGIFIFAFACSCLLAGCAGRRGEKAPTSKGVDDGVEGFLFNFDQREEVSILVDYKKKGKYPVKATWYYNPEGEVLSRNKIEAAAITTSDEKKIRDIYYALSNTIILGVASGQSSDIKYFVSLTLPDGEECRFDFVNETTIRLSSQNYVAETDGSLWSALVMPEEEISESESL